MLDDPSNSMMFAEGRNRFGQAHSRAFFSQFLDILRGRSLELLSFDDVKDMLDLQQQSYRGLQDIPLERIVGSVGRPRDFTRQFLPKNSSMSERWSRIYALFHSLEGPPPIEVYLIDDVYFVRDGNHRVSVARQMGLKTIQAYVTELPTPIDIEPNMTQAQWDAASAYAHFLRETGLSETRPEQVTISVTDPGGYETMLDHIKLLQQVRNHVEGAELSLWDAAAEWYDNVYRPAITLIRKYDVLGEHNVSTEADLYLWMMEHLRQLREEYGDENPQRLSDALVDYLTTKKIPIPKDLIFENDTQPPLG